MQKLWYMEPRPGMADRLRILYQRFSVRMIQIRYYKPLQVAYNTLSDHHRLRPHINAISGKKKESCRKTRFQRVNKHDWLTSAHNRPKFAPEHTTGRGKWGKDEREEGRRGLVSAPVAHGPMTMH